MEIQAHAENVKDCDMLGMLFFSAPGRVRFGVVPPRSRHCVQRSADSLKDEQLRELLMRSYVEAGFTELEVAKHLFEPSSVRARGELLYITGDDETLLGMIVAVRSGAPACKLAQADEGELQLLATSPNCRRQGIGRALVQAALAELKTAGCTSVVLWTQPAMHAAQQLYLGCGFRRAPERDFETRGKLFLVFEIAL